MKRWIKISLLTIVLIIGTGVILFDVILEGMLKTKLESVIQQQKDRVYDYKFEDIHLKFISGDISLTNLEIIPRKHVIDSLNKIGQKKVEIFDVKLEEFRLEGLKSWKLLLYDEIEIESIVLESPVVKVYMHQREKLHPNKDLAGDIIAPTIKMALVNNFELNYAKFEIHNVLDDTSLAMSFDTASISITSFYTDSTLLSNGEILSYEELHFNLNSVKITSLKDYIYELDEVKNEFYKKEVFLLGLRLTPKLDKFDFMKNQPYETDWFDLNIDSIRFKNPDVEAYQKSSKIIIENVLISGISLELYRDKRLPDTPPKIKYLPSKIMRDLKLSISVPTVDVKNADIKYLEWEIGAEKPIVVNFNNAEISIENMTTDKDRLAINDNVKIHLKTSFMKSGYISSDFIFPVLDTSDLFFMEGRIENLNLPSLNPVLQHSAFVKFEEGKLNYIDFKMKADDISSNGVLDIDFEGMKKVQIVRNKDEQDARKEKGKQRKEQKFFWSFMANTLIPNSYNPDSKNYYSGQIKFERNRDKAIFNYLVKSITSGVITSLIPSKQDNYKVLKHEKKMEHKKEKQKKKDGSKKK